VIKAFQDSIDRHLPNFQTFDRLRATTIPKFSYDKQILHPFDNVITTTDNPITIIKETQI
jgi:hypothetical protein